MCFRGPSVITGYLNLADAGINTKDWNEEGYYHSGDIGYCDSTTGKWYIVDRKKELIRVREFQVAPPEVEAVLQMHPRVLDCGVIGVPAAKEVDAEVPRAYIVVDDAGNGERITEDGVRSLVADRLAKYKRLEGVVVFVEAAPKNPIGTILKRDLREWAKKEMAEERGLRAKL